MTRKEDILYEAISEDTSIKKVRGFSTTYPSLCNLKLFQNIDGTWLTAQDDIGVSITIKMSDLNDFVHCENLDHNSRWKESEEKMTYKENITAILECCFAGFKEEIIEAACNRILGLEPKTEHCKDCKYFEYDSVVKVDGIPLIVAHEICSKWGDGCKTCEDGYCFLFEPQESEV